MSKIDKAPYTATVTLSTPDTPPGSPPSCTISIDARIKDGMCSMIIHKRIPVELAMKVAHLIEENDDALNKATT